MGLSLALPERKSLKSIRGGSRLKGKSLIPSKRTKVDGFDFDSQAEADYYELVLKPMRLQCDIYQHPIVQLTPNITWKLDFLVVQKGKCTLIDVKGMRITREATLKITLWRTFGAHELQIIKKDPYSGQFLKAETIEKGEYKIENFTPSILNLGKKM